MEPKVVYNIFHLVYWDWRIALDLFLGGAGAGAFLYAMFIYYHKNKQKLLVVKIGSVIAPVAVALGILAMFTEMGHPFRILNTLIYFNPTSVLSWGGLLQQIFIALSAFFAFLLLSGKNEALRETLGIVVALCAICIGFYHGFLLSFVTARPLWNSGVSTIISLVSLIATGIVTVLICASYTEKGRKEIEELSGVTGNLLIVSLLIQVVAILVWIISLATGGVHSVSALNALNSEFGMLFWLGVVLAGTAAPFILLVNRRGKPFPVFLISALILIGGFIFRYVLVLCGQMS